MQRPLGEHVSSGAQGASTLHDWTHSPRSQRVPAGQSALKMQRSPALPTTGGDAASPSTTPPSADSLRGAPSLLSSASQARATRNVQATHTMVVLIDEHRSSPHSGVYISVLILVLAPCRVRAECAASTFTEEKRDVRQRRCRSDAHDSDRRAPSACSPSPPFPPWPPAPPGLPLKRPLTPLTAKTTVSTGLSR